MHVVAGKPSVGVRETGIYWAPVSQSIRLSFAGTDQATVSKALTDTFGKFPIRLSDSHILTIKAMYHAAGVGGKPYSDLYDALQKFGQLELTEA